ncbi:MAG: AAA family ATPase [Chthoniobacterales bacterium]
MAFSRTVAFEYLQRAFENKRLAHAYVFAGPVGSGKRALASDVANVVNGVELHDIFAARSAGIHIAEPESKSRRIVIEQIRELEQTLQMRAQTGRRKVAIIVDADRLQPQAANAFLKTLEEPPNDSLLLLLSALPEALPDTILSRCIMISLAAGSGATLSAEDAELVELLGSVATAPVGGGVHVAYRLAQGLHGLLVRIRENILGENAASLKRDEVKYKNTTDGAWLDEREDYFKALTESLYVQRRAGLIETLLLWWSDVLRASTGVARTEFPEVKEQTAAVARRLSTSQILRRIRRIEELRDHLGRNIQEALAIEVAFLTIFSF